MIFMNSPARDSEISNARLKIDYKLIIFVDSTSNWMVEICWKGKKIVSYRKFWVKDYEEREMLEVILKWTELIKLKKLAFGSNPWSLGFWLKCLVKTKEILRLWHAEMARHIFGVEVNPLYKENGKRWPFGFTLSPFSPVANDHRIFTGQEATLASRWPGRNGRTEIWPRLGSELICLAQSHFTDILFCFIN